MPKGYWPIWTTVLIDLIGFGIALPVLGIYATTKFGASGFMVGVLGSAYSAAQFLFAPLLGKLSDRFGRKPVLIASLVGTAFAALMTGLAGSLWLLIVWRFIDGASGASFGVASSAIADIAPPHRRAALVGMLGAAFGIGFTIGPAIGALASWLGGDRAPFFLLAAMSAVNAVAAVIRIPETKGLAVEQAAEADAVEGGSGLAKRWTQSGFPIVLTITVLTGFAFTAFEILFSKFGQAELGMTQKNAGFALAVVGIVSSVVQGGLIGPVTKKVGSMALIRWGLLTTAIGLVMFGAADGWLLLLPSMLVLAVGQGFAGPSISAEGTNRVHPSKRGELLGLQQSGNAGASVLGPLAAGLVYDHLSHSAPFFAAAALFVISVALAWVLRPAPLATNAVSVPVGPAIV
jgi:MFS transporter, DHA1 family, tetracycline resistance protein